MLALWPSLFFSAILDARMARGDGFSIVNLAGQHEDSPPNDGCKPACLERYLATAQVTLRAFGLVFRHYTPGE